MHNISRTSLSLGDVVCIPNSDKLYVVVELFDNHIPTGLVELEKYDMYKNDSKLFHSTDVIRSTKCLGVEITPQLLASLGVFDNISSTLALHISKDLRIEFFMGNFEVFKPTHERDQEAEYSGNFKEKTCLSCIFHASDVKYLHCLQHYLRTVNIQINYNVLKNHV